MKISRFLTDSAIVYSLPHQTGCGDAEFSARHPYGLDGNFLGVDLPPINRATGKLVKSDIGGVVGHEEAVYG